MFHLQALAALSLCAFINTHTHTHIYVCVCVCVGAKCHIDRLIAVVSDSRTLWLVDSSLIHTPPWVIGPAHWFPACQPSQEEPVGRKRACRYRSALDHPHPHPHLHIMHTPNAATVLQRAGGHGVCGHCSSLSSRPPFWLYLAPSLPLDFFTKVRSFHW